MQNNAGVGGVWCEEVDITVAKGSYSRVVAGIKE
jgi:hypothetical protein